MNIQVIQIVEGTSVDGPGLRTSIYLAGCTHHCPGCQNPQTWDPAQGSSMTIDELCAKVEDAGMNVTFSGGDPLMQPEAVAAAARAIKQRLGFTVWCYTGYTFEQVVASPRLSQVLPWLDVLVDGPFIESQRDISLIFRGSANQRLVDLGAWRATGKIVEWVSPF